MVGRQRVSQLNPTMFRWDSPNGRCRVHKIPGNIVFSGCYGGQIFANAGKLHIIEFCKKALSSPEFLRTHARDHKGEVVDKGSLHKQVELLRTEGVLDPYTWKRFMHMTRNCESCDPNRLYYRLKNFFGMEREHIVDQLSFKKENPWFEKTINGFLLFCKELERQGFKPDTL